MKTLFLLSEKYLKANGRKYGNTKTDLILTDEAELAYSNSWPNDIYEMPDGTYSMRGWTEADEMTSGEVNAALAELMIVYEEDFL